MKECVSSLSNGNNANILGRFQDPMTLIVTGGHIKITDRSNN